MFNTTKNKTNTKGTVKVISACLLFISSAVFAITTANQTSANALTLEELDLTQTFIYKNSH